jgi:hypothetical protein
LCSIHPWRGLDDNKIGNAVDCIRVGVHARGRLEFGLQQHAVGQQLQHIDIVCVGHVGIGGIDGLDCIDHVDLRELDRIERNERDKFFEHNDHHERDDCFECDGFEFIEHEFRSDEQLQHRSRKHGQPFEFVEFVEFVVEFERRFDGVDQRLARWRLGR